MIELLEDLLKGINECIQLNANGSEPEHVIEEI